MKKEEYNVMIDMLIKVTKNKTLKWEQLNPDIYSTEISGCEIRLESKIDFSISDNYYSLVLSNVEGVEFMSLNYFELTDTVEYQMLNELFSAIKDSFFQIAESEERIMNGLRSMLKGDSEKTELPF